MKIIAILAKSGSGIETAIRAKYQPTCQNALLHPGAIPRYIDENGDRWHYIETRDERGLLDALRGIQNAPQVSVQVIGEIVDDADVNGRPVRWGGHGKSLAIDVPKSEVIGHLVTKIPINSASKKMLKALDGVGNKLAQRIIDGRPYADVDDLTAISGITQSAVDGWEVVA